MRLALTGLRVIEGASFIAAPYCGLHLAQMGADVIRFDQIGGGPDFHRWPLAGNGASLYWEGLNKGKRSIAIDLTRPQGRELAQALITAAGEDAGVFVTNFPESGFLAYERLRTQRPDLICLRVMGWADGTPAVDYTINAAIGIPLMTGHPDDERPVNHVLPAWDLLAGAYGAFALVAAERQRRQGGGGQHLKLALSDLAACTLNHLGQTAEAALGGNRPRMGNDLFGAFGRDFLTRDAHRIMVVAITTRQWADLVDALGLARDIERIEAELGVLLSHEGVRFEHRARLFPLFENAFASRDLADIRRVFGGRGVCWSVYKTVREAMTGAESMIAGNPLFTTLSQPSGLQYEVAGPPLRDAAAAAHAAPRLGQHTDEVLADVLGLSSAQIGRLHGEQLVAGVPSA